MKNRVLCFDYGASSGRAMLCAYENGKINLEEIHRFDNTPVNLNGTLYWDFLRLFQEMKTGIIKAKLAGGFDSVGIDTWGVDFGCIDACGNLISNPVHYRDKRTDGIMEEVFKIIPKEKIYDITGVQFLQFNTIYQLFYMSRFEKETLEKTAKIVMIPDLFAYYLTGTIACERTIASTSQLLAANTSDWDKVLLEKLGLNASLFPKIIDSGSCYGNLNKTICNELDCDPVPVYAVCCHDTASAVLSVPTVSDNPAYISCGTWSLLGTELEKPLITKSGFAAQYTNEIGYGKSVRYLKNIMGLWIINECRRDFMKSGINVGYSEIANLASRCEGKKYIIDVDDKVFLKPDDMPKKIVDYCKRKYGSSPETVGEIARCVYDSLSVKYAESLKKLSELTGKKFDTLYMIGGGCNAELLCRLTADECKIRVSAGPSEATVIGNAAAQFLATKQIKDVKTAREIISKSFDLKQYFPT